MKNFSTGYQYIDERTNNIKEQLPENLKSELEYVLSKVHSVGVDHGYSAGKERGIYEASINQK
jgi:hypothetical protein